MDVAVWVADEEMNFELHDIFTGGYGPTEQGRFTDIPMDGVSTQAIRLYPRYQGWGHQWGEVEFWVYDKGYFDAEVTGLGASKNYFYRSFVSNSGGSKWAPTTKSFKAEDIVRYEGGRLVIHTDLGTWKHSNGDNRAGVINRKTYNDPNGNEYAYEVCSFVFDRVELLGDLEVVVRGQNSLEIVAQNGDCIIHAPIDISGSMGGADSGKPGGGWDGGEVAGKGRGPGGGLPGLSPGGGGYGGAGSGATFTSGQPYGDGMISSYWWKWWWWLFCQHSRWWRWWCHSFRGKR